MRRGWRGGGGWLMGEGGLMVIWGWSGARPGEVREKGGEKEGKIGGGGGGGKWRMQKEY